MTIDICKCNWSSNAVSFVLLFGCPLPPSETTNDNPKVNVQGNAPQQNGGAPGANPGAGGKPPGAPANVGGEMQGLQVDKVVQQENQVVY